MVKFTKKSIKDIVRHTTCVYDFTNYKSVNYIGCYLQPNTKLRYEVYNVLTENDYNVIVVLKNYKQLVRGDII